MATVFPKEKNCWVTPCLCRIKAAVSCCSTTSPFCAENAAAESGAVSSPCCNELCGQDAVILETESPEKATTETEKELRTRRIAFYLHNGARKTAIRSSVLGVPYEILCLECAKPATDENLRRKLGEIYRQMFAPELIGRVMIE